MPPIRSSAFKRFAYVITLILSLSEIMPIYFCYIDKGLVYIVIMAPFSR